MYENSLIFFSVDTKYDSKWNVCLLLYNLWHFVTKRLKLLYFVWKNCFLRFYSMIFISQVKCCNFCSLSLFLFKWSIDNCHHNWLAAYVWYEIKRRSDDNNILKWYQNHAIETKTSNCRCDVSIFTGFFLQNESLLRSWNRFSNQ